MKNATILEAVRLYSENVILPSHNNPEHYNRWFKDYAGFETQLLTDKDGEPVEGTNKFADDTGQVWGPVRWPWRAKTNNPEWRDSPRKFLFDDHLLAIGSTGWHWKNRESRYLGYDFDAITGHAAGIGYSDADLEQVARNAPDFVDVVRSTRGGGKHLIIEFDEPFPKTANHSEHAALARAFIPVMAATAGFDFSTHMDCCGMVLWIWSKDTTPENQGFANIRKATRHVTAKDVPPNWRDHLDVVSGSRGKVRVRGWTPEGMVDADCDADTESAPKVPLDECHKRFLSDLEDTGFSYFWVHDHYLAQTHTCAIKQVHDAWRVAGHPMKGPFDTSAPGSDKAKPNTFMRPRLGGGWDVYRFGTPEEHPLWDNFNGKTHITLNIEPSLRQGAMAATGFECVDPKDGYTFTGVDAMYSALKYMGSDFKLSDTVPRPEERTYQLKTRKADSRIILLMDRQKDDRDGDFVGWERKNATTWQKLLADRANTRQAEDQTAAYWENRIRVIKSVSMADTGSVAGECDHWVLRDDGGKWVKHPRDNIATVVNNVAGSDALKVMSAAICTAWTRVNKPFEPEYPGGREWNYDAAQYVFKPKVLKEGEVPHHPHWDLVFNHCGSGLDKYVAELGWCKEWGMRNGGDYLRAWVAAMLRFPYCRLPYLFMFSAASCTGKTTWHETVKLLLTKGVDPADKALTSSSDFNGELANTILGTIDETDITKAGRNVYNKVKDWTTAVMFAVRALYKQTYIQPNILHLVQTSNERGSCPVNLGDSRITVIEVPIIKEHIGKEDLADACMREGPDFMATLMALHLPKHSDRMRVPVIETDAKAAAIEDSRDALEVFLMDHCTYMPGSLVKFDEFYAEFIGSVDKFDRPTWPEPKVKASLPSHFPHGKYSRNIRFVGNIALGTDVGPTDIEADKFVSSDGKLVKENDIQR